ncbi:MAG: signal recognition particle-docking protein FtsY [Desulfobacterales bacterium]|nr:signal recognition particle-docking protein FtsY [Desulfobacterales bacterium]
MAFGWFKKKTPAKDEQPEKEPASQPVEETDDPETETPDTPKPAKEPADRVVAMEADQILSEPADPEPEEDQPGQAQGPGPDQEKSGGFFKRLKKGLSKTRKVLTTDIDELFTGKVKVDDEMLEELEELLITADIGVQTTMDIIERLRKKAPRISGPEDLKEILKAEIQALMDVAKAAEAVPVSKPHVIMVIGVNGVGKTTTIGKLAAKAHAAGQKVLIAAADTFRAAAIEQLTIWAQRAEADIVKHRENSDPAAVAYDSVEAAIARGADLVIIDTAGRLHTKVNLMEELKKIKRSVSKKLATAPHETLLVLDATTGQNAFSQAKLFNEAMEITGLALTKLDGTAKGGIVVAISSNLNIPLKYIGVGEQIDDLQVFDPERFVDALF